MALHPLISQSSSSTFFAALTPNKNGLPTSVFWLFLVILWSFALGLAQNLWAEEDDGDDVAEEGSRAQCRVVQQLTCCKATQPLERLHHHLTEAIRGPADEVDHCSKCKDSEEHSHALLKRCGFIGLEPQHSEGGRGQDIRGVGASTLGTTGTTSRRHLGSACLERELDTVLGLFGYIHFVPSTLQFFPDQPHNEKWSYLLEICGAFVTCGYRAYFVGLLVLIV